MWAWRLSAWPTSRPGRRKSAAAEYKVEGAATGRGFPQGARRVQPRFRGGPDCALGARDGHGRGATARLPCAGGEAAVGLHGQRPADGGGGGRVGPHLRRDAEPQVRPKPPAPQGACSQRRDRGARLRCTATSLSPRVFPAFAPRWRMCCSRTWQSITLTRSGALLAPTPPRSCATSGTPAGPSTGGARR